MEKIKIEDIDTNKAYFHFTKEKNIKQIEKGGITTKPTERENTVMKDEENPCIYFSVGDKGLLKTVDVWIRYEYNNLAFANKFPSGDKKINDNILRKTYEKVYEDFKKRMYLVLDLKEGDNPQKDDFSFEAKDYKKEAVLKRKKIPETFKWLYGNYSDFNSPKMEDWNMNTYIGDKIIESERIKIVTDSEKNKSALAIIKELYAKNKENLKLESLGKFMEYVNNRDKNEEKMYYHHTKVEYLQSIIEKGLRPENGANSKVTSDKKSKVFISEEMKGAIAMASAFQFKFNTMKKGTELENADINEFLGERVFLRFPAKGIENENTNDFAFADGWISETIEPSKIKVCILKNLETGEISYQRDDIINYMLAVTPKENFENLANRHKFHIEKYYESRNKEIEKIDTNKYSLEDLEIEKFYEQFIKNRDNSDRKKYSTQQIGKTTINTSTMQKDIAYDKVISKVHERNHPEEIHEHRIEE